MCAEGFYSCALYWPDLLLEAAWSDCLVKFCSRLFYFIQFNIYKIVTVHIYGLYIKFRDRLRQLFINSKFLVFPF